MDKKYYVLRLIPDRPDFPYTMTPEEKTIMSRHADYWKQKMAEGWIIVYGPVFDPACVYGLGVLQVDNEQQVLDFMAGDPASAIHRYEWCPMNAIFPARPVSTAS